MSLKLKLLLHWDKILEEKEIDSVKVNTKIIDGRDSDPNISVTNALPLLKLGFAPAYTVEGTTATLSFTNAPEIAIGEIDLGALPDIGITASITNTSIGLPKWSDGVEYVLGVWGAPTLTSEWSKVESTCDLSSYLTDGSAVFSFEAGTNRFFKVKAE